MNTILYLVHRIPYPPNKGDKIRSFNILKYLAQSHRVFVGAFVDDPHDWRYVDDVKQYAAETCLLGVNPQVAKLKSLSGFLTGSALSIPYYRNSKMQAWVNKILAEQKIDRVLVFSSAMAQYVEGIRNIPRTIDFVDVDADKWRQYAEKKSWPASWLYRREAERLLEFDRRVAGNFDRSIFVSEAEAALFAGLAPEVAERVTALENGVDTEFFHSAGDYPNPYSADNKVLVFTGAMDYWANIDAVVWFAENVFPALRRIEPAARFFVVGARPTETVRALTRIEGVSVTGGVKDIRPYLRFADVAVAPLRIARGIQNKVLEAMAMELPVLASPAALEGIASTGNLDIAVADAPEEWVEKAAGLLTGGAATGGSARNRAFVEARYSWATNLARLNDIMGLG